MDISILITTYNASRYIAETLNSIIAQSYQQYEIIIVDDGSTDNTVEIIKSFKASQSQPIFIYQHPHMGRAPALKKALSYAAFNWIAIIDADDLWHPEKLSIQVQCIQKRGLSFLATLSETFSSDLEIKNTIDKKVTYHPISQDAMLLSNLICHSSVLARKEHFQYALSRRNQIDYDNWLRLLNNGITLYQLNTCLTYHRIHANQSFEAKSFSYQMSTIRLQLHHALINRKWKVYCLILMKSGYYLIPRKLRLRLRSFAKKRLKEKECVASQA